jgi:hypothetical protein
LPPTDEQSGVSVDDILTASGTIATPPLEPEAVIVVQQEPEVNLAILQAAETIVEDALQVSYIGFLSHPPSPTLSSPLAPSLFHSSSSLSLSHTLSLILSPRSLSHPPSPCLILPPLYSLLEVHPQLLSQLLVKWQD